jgi:hypothetical protein
MNLLAVPVPHVLVKGPRVDNRINDANLTDTAPLSIVFNLSQQNATHPASRFRPNNVEPSRPRASVGSEYGESQDLSFFVYSNVIPPPLIEVAVEMGAVVHNVFNVLENCIFD